MLLHQDLVLHVEVTHVVIKVDVFGNHKTSHASILNSSCEGDPGRVRVVYSIDGLGNSSFVARLVISIRSNKLTDVFNVRLKGSSHENILLKEVVSVEDVKYMTEGVLGLFANQIKLVKKSVLRDSVRHCHYQVIAVGEKLESVLQEVVRSTVKGSLHTEEGHSKSIFSPFWRFRDAGEVIKGLDELLNFRVLTVLYVLFNFRKRNKLLEVGLASSLEGSALLVEIALSDDSEVRHHSVEFSHSLDSLQ